MGLITLVISFEYTAFYIFQSVFGLNEGGFGLRVFSIVFFALAVMKSMKCLMRYNNKKIWAVLFGLMIFLVMILSTRMTYGYWDEKYRGYLLSFGVRCIPAALCGIVLAKEKKYFSQMQKWLQIFILMYTVGILLVTLKSGHSEYIQFRYKTGGMNYQTLSYCAAFAFNMDLYLVLFWNDVDKFKMFRGTGWRIIDICLLFIHIYCLFAGGGRGAMGDILVVGTILAYVKNGSRINIRTLIIGAVLLAVVFAALYYAAGKTDNVGANRLFSFFSDKEQVLNNERTELRKNAIEAFWQNPALGNGIGSIFYVMGNYSHNMFTDILVEGGIVLFSIAVGISIFLFKNIRRFMNSDRNNCMIYMIFLSSFTMLMFSSYYLADGGLWFAATYLLYSHSEEKRMSLNSRRTEYLMRGL